MNRLKNKYINEFAKQKNAHKNDKIFNLVNFLIEFFTQLSAVLKRKKKRERKGTKANIQHSLS